MAKKKKTTRKTEMKPVKSSNIQSIGYYAHGYELYIQFINGGLYVYFDVKREEVTGLLRAASKGRYFWKWIRDTYAYARIG